jgi:hypothetical protein
MLGCEFVHLLHRRPDTRVLALCNNWERVAVPYSPAEFGERLLIMGLDNIARSWLNDGPTLEASPSEHDDGLDLRVLAQDVFYSTWVRETQDYGGRKLTKWARIRLKTICSQNMASYSIPTPTFSPLESMIWSSARPKIFQNPSFVG